MSADNDAKTRTNFVSGSLIGWSLNLIGLRNRVVTYPAGGATEWDSAIELPTFAALNFSLLAIVLGFGFAVAALGVTYLISRGLRVRPGTGVDADGARFEKISVYAYDGVFNITKIAVVYALLLMPFYGAVILNGWLRGALGISPGFANAVSIVVAGAPVLVVTWVALARLGDDVVTLGGLIPWLLRRVPPIAVLIIAVAAAVETSFTIELDVDPPLVTLADNRYVRFQVQLGGLSSDPTRAVLLVTDSGGAIIDTLNLLPLRPGVYQAFVPTARLSTQLSPTQTGSYKVTLTYTRPSREGKLRLWGNRTRTSWFQVAP